MSTEIERKFLLVNAPEWLRDHQAQAAYRGNIAEKTITPGRSAPTLAAAWGGPAELFAALAGVPDLGAFLIETVDLEVQTAFSQTTSPTRVSCDRRAIGSLGDVSGPGVARADPCCPGFPLESQA